MMKKYLLILLLFCAFIPFAQAQQVPQGMKYQAVARSLMGEVLANQPVTLRISLNSKLIGATRTHYSETHSVTTNALGLFDLTIGAGKVSTGTFKNVPWSAEDVWMEIAIQDGGKSGFSTVSSSRLLAVPYAFHAMTANELVGNPKARAAASGPDDGVPGNVWSTFGNTRTDPTTDRMGTMDYVDLIFVTNKIERLRITKDGDINIKNSLKVGKDVEVGNNLTVKQNVFLNTTGGATVNNGPLTVANGKPTVLTGTLNVNGATDLDNTLNVDGIATISNTTESTGKTNGALIVVGGVGIGKNLNVGGNGDVDGTLNVDGATTLNNTLNVVGNTTIQGITNITNSTQSTLTTNGAFIVAGGVGIGKNINVGGNGDIDGTLNADGATTLNSTLIVTGVTTLNNKLNTNGQVTIDANVNGGDGDYNSYPLRVQGSNQGIAIKVDGSRDNTTNFVTFMDANGTWGRIEGQTTTELEDSQEYKTQVALYVLEGVATAADILGLGTEGVALAATIIGIPAAVGVAAQAAAVVIRAAALVTEAVTWSNDVHNNVGVAYESGSGDYAEWLERGKTEADMVFGQIVGVKGGNLSLRTDKADHYMVISKSPIVLGNMPQANREKDFEKVAFMGQVPVRVVGKVAIGDYVIPSGNHDGFGLAIHPADMKLGDYARIVGVAWQAAKDAPLNIVNVAVGINTNDLTSKMVAMSQQLDSLSRKTDNILAFLQGKAPLQAADAVTGPPTGRVGGVVASAPAQTTLTKLVSDADFDRTIDKTTPQLLQYFGEAKNQLSAKGIDVSGNPYLAAFFNDPIASVKQLRRDPTMSTQWGRVDQQLQKKK